MHVKIQSVLAESLMVKEKIANDLALIEVIEKVSSTMVLALKGGKKVLFCGNGGSAADAQHLSSELSGRFYLNRPALYAEALNVNTSAITAIGNDFDFSEIYARQIEGQGQAGDILIALSTSGNSSNIIKAVHAARKKGMIIVGMTGANGGQLKSICDYLLAMPSNNTPRIQEAHITVGHIICEIVEAAVFPEA